MENFLNPKCHQLCFYGNVLLFNCQRTSGTNDSKTGELKLVLRRLSFDRENKAFLKAVHGSFTIGGETSSHADILKCKCVMNVQKRITTPCILVLRKSESGERFLYSVLTLSSSNRLELCFEFILPYKIGGNVSILRGPTVMWSHAGDHFFISLRTAEVRHIPVQLSHCVFGELPPKVFVLGLQDLSRTLSTSQSLGCFIENGHIFDGSMILPHPYISITRCIFVLPADKAGGDELVKSAVVAATSYQQLVYFENGIVKNACQLPFEQPENIQLVDTGRNGCLFAISFQEGHVCTVWRETFQIASNWSDVTSVHVGDFLGCGSDQMLLVFEDHGMTGQPLQRFLLTDLCGISYTHCQDREAPKTSPSPAENSLLTLQALESRLQSGLSILQELQREVRVKERVIQQSVQALTDVVSEREFTLTQPEQEGLIALWDCDDKSKEDTLDNKTQDMPAVSSKLQADKLWHRITGDRMVVGVILTTDSSIPVASVGLSILTETSQNSVPAVIQSQSQVFWLSTPCSSSSSSSSTASMFPEPAAKRSKQHNELNTCRLAVTAVTRLTPLLNCACVKCSVILHYIPKQHVFAPVSNAIPFVLYCGEITLDIHSECQMQLLKNTELKSDEIKQDLLSLMAMLDHWVFHIDSPDYSLGDVESWIHKRNGCKRIEVSHQYLLDSSQPSALMLLNWHQITTFQGELSIHSSQLRMLQFLDSFMAYLPVSCAVRPVKATNAAAAAHVLSLALEKEVLSLRDSVSLLLCEGGTDEWRGKSLGHDETSGPASVKDLQRCREVWQMDVEKSRKRLSPLVDVGRYRRLTQSMSNVQLHADLAALLYTQRTLPS